VTSEFVRVFSHPLRRRLLFEYTEAAASPAELARRLSEPLNAVAYHTGILARDGYVELARTERRRGALTHYYRSTIPLAVDGADWETLGVDVRRALVLGALDHAHAAARRAVAAGGFDGLEVQLSRSPMLLDEEGLDALASCLRDAFAAISAVVSDVPEAPRADYEIVLLAYERG